MPNSHTKSIRRTCSVCGDNIDVTIHRDGTYQGGHYWDFEEEYWECDDCYEEADSDE